MSKKIITLTSLERIESKKGSSPKEQYIGQMMNWKNEGSYTHYYKCPCGKGRIVDDKDTTPGFRCHDIIIECAECREAYEIVE